MCSDHPRLTTGGSVSNHTFGRGLDIASIDGEIVGPGSALAREVASELSQFDPAHPAGRDRLAVRDQRARLLHRRRAPEPHPRRLQDRDHARLQAPRRRRAAQRRRAAAAAARRRAAGAPRRRRRRAAPGARATRSQGAPACSRAARAGQGRRAPAPRRQARPRLEPVPAGRRGREGQQQPQPRGRAGAAGRSGAAVDLTGVPGGYPGDDAPKEQIAAWMAAEAKKRGLPAQLPVMAALVESNLTNVNFGDADSLGYFQMRVSIWNRRVRRLRRRPREAGRLVPRHRRTRQGPTPRRGQSITDPNQFGEWIADVERPAEQYRGRYQLKLDDSQRPPRQRPQHRPPHAARRTGRAGRAGPADAALEPAPRDGARRGPKALAALKEAEKYTGHAVQVGRLDAADGVRLLRPRAVGLRAGGRPDPARDRRADRGAERDGGAPLRAAPGRPRLLPRRRAATSTTSASRWAATSSCTRRTPATWSRSRASTSRTTRSSSRAGGASTPPARPRRRRCRPRRSRRRHRRSTRSRSPRRRRPSRATPPRRASRTAASSRRSTPRRRATTRRTRAATARWRAPPPRRAGAERARAGDSALFCKAITRGAGREGQGRGRRRQGRRCARRTRGRRRGRAASLAAARRRPGGRRGGARGRGPAGPPPDLADVPADYPGDDAGQKALAKWLAKRAEKAGLPPELPVMASLVESGVRNLNFGDADSVGFFQMRVGIWNRGEYAGYPKNPGAAGEVVHRQRRSRSSGSGSPRATPASARTRASGASGSPTSSVRPSSTAGATSSASPRRAGC